MDTCKIVLAFYYSSAKMRTLSKDEEEAGGGQHKDNECVLYGIYVDLG